MLYKAEKRRVIGVGMLFTIAYLMLIARLYYLQIIQHHFFSSLATQQYTITVKHYPARGQIFDRKGLPLALCTEGSSAFIMPNTLRNKKQVTTFLREFFPCAYTQLPIRQHKKFMYIARHLTPELEAHIKKAALKDIYFIHEPTRIYPNNACRSIVGTTNHDNKGAAGIELSCQQILAGTPALYRLAKDGHSGFFYFEKEELETECKGTDLALTLDSTLQFLMQKKLKKYMTHATCHEGGVVILDPTSGDILTMASYTEHETESQTLRNNCVAHAYEFGSVSKLFVAAAALQEGVVRSEELIDCKNKKTTYLDGRMINTWKEEGIIPFTEVIAHSNNIGIAIVAKRLDTLLYEHYKKLGFGKRLPIALPGTHKGFLNHPAQWSKQSLISLSYGYEISCTLLHLAIALTPFAHNGHKVRPRLLLDDPIEVGQQLYSPETVETLRAILQQTTEHGTAYRARMKGYNVMCKTGSAHMVENGVYSNEKNIYSCIGIIEKDGYQRIIAVYVQKKGAGQEKLFASTIAVPLFETVAQTMLVHEQVISNPL